MMRRGWIAATGSLLVLCGIAGAGIGRSGAATAWAQAGRQAVSAPVLIGTTLGGDAINFSVEGAYVSGQGWRDTERSHRLFRRGTRFTPYDPAGRVLGTFRIGKVEDAEEYGYYASASGKLRPAPNGAGNDKEETWLLALAGDVKSALARPQSLDSPAYRANVADQLRRKGLTVARPRLIRHLRLDLNGDGTDEALLEARSHVPSSSGSGTNDTGRHDGNYSTVLLRFVPRGGQAARTMPLATTVLRRGTESDVVRHTLLGCADIDGDGHREILIQNAYYEGGAVSIFTFDGRSARRVLGPSE